MTLFWVLAAALLVLALALVLPGLLRRRADERLQIAGGASRANLAILREQMSQLQSQRDDGTLAEGPFLQARSELERRALDEEAAIEMPARVGRSTVTAVLLSLTVPLLALGLYGWVGNPQAIMAPSMADGDSVSQAQIEAMVAQLAQRLENPPAGQAPDPEGWEMLARSYASMQRFAQADRAYLRARDLAPRNAQLLVDHADVLAMLQGQSAAGEPTRLIERALAIDPVNLKALALAGTAALERKDAAAAVDYWTRARALATPNSDFAAGLDRSLEVARAELKGAPLPQLATAPVAASAASASAPAATVVSAPSAASAIQGVVTLAPALAAQVAPGDTLFIFARAAEGPRMPLAILKRQASELPLKFTLDDSTAMSKDMTLSKAPKVMVQARISRSGNAMPQPGDLLGQVGPVAPGASGLTITISSVQP
jgi:cytochrome c-type biogenesis protein CcmH